MESFGKRLKQAIDDWGSIRSFQKTMEERLAGTGVDGYSYPSINEYLKDRVSPRLEFVEHAADVLGVRQAWLATGGGERTRAEEMAARYGEDDRSPGQQVLDALRYRLGAGFSEGHLGMSEPQQRQFLQLLVRYVQAGEDGEKLLDFDGEPPEELLELAGDLHFLIWLPVESGAWGFESLDYRRRDQLNEYVTAMMHALSLWIRERGGWLPVEKAEDSTIREARKAVESRDEEEG